LQRTTVGIAAAADEERDAIARQGTTMMLRACLCGLLVMMAGPLGAGERLALKVSPAVCFAPANLVVRATIQADRANRAVEVVAESTDFYRSSEIELDGENAPRTNMFEFRSLPSGTYEVRVTLRGGGGEQIANVRQQVNVIDAGGAR
jgi:hypothetical protein